jgi:asparagine synthase (glutamine-hydrolysing)
MYDAKGNLSEYEYWQSKNIQEDFNRKEEDFVEEARELILDAITIRANYEGKYGTLLSGGIDTSIIAATLASQQEHALVKGFSVTFEEIFYSDADLQEIMYSRYNIKPHTTTLRANDYSNILQKGIAYLDKPVNDDAFVGMYKAFELAKQCGCDVVFDGEAADELFFTGHAQGEKAFQKFLFPPFWLRRVTFGKLIPFIPVGDSFWKKGWRFLYKIGLSDEERILTRLPCFYNHATNILLDPDPILSEDPHQIGKMYLAESALQDPLNRYHYGILKTFLTDDLLFKNERMASANGIINRTPFIDYRLVELAFKIPARYKLARPTEHDDGTKQIYKKAIKGLIPDEILHRKKKRGFSQPSSVWYRRELKDFVHGTLFSQESLCPDYLNKAYMKQLFSEHVSGKANFDRWLSSLLIFELWLKAFLK